MQISLTKKGFHTLRYPLVAGIRTAVLPCPELGPLVDARHPQLEFSNIRNRLFNWRLFRHIAWILT